MTNLSDLLHIIDLEHDIDLALALRKAGRPRRQERAHKGWQTRRAACS